MVNTIAPQYLGNPLLVDDYEFPGVTPQSFEVLQYANAGFAYGIEGNGLNGSVEGSTFSIAATSSGLYNFFEETPYIANATGTTTDSINDVLAYDPTGIPLAIACRASSSGSSTSICRSQQRLSTRSICWAPAARSWRPSRSPGTCSACSERGPW